MQENYDTEFKQSWRDEYLKTLCAFANTHGGILYVGKDDNGNTVGLSNDKKSLEDLPNKIKNKLGIWADIQRHETDGKDYLSIEVEDYPYQAISYDGRYYRRSGSTTQLISGAELDHFLLKRCGTTWDAVPMTHITSEDLSPSAIARFKSKVMQTARIGTEIQDLDNRSLLDKLHLLSPRGELTRAAVLLFHNEPERWITNAGIQIAKFNNQGELLFDDRINGSLIEQIDKTLDLIKTKYLTYDISFEGASRRERLRLPEIALRESLLNAIAHKDYSDFAKTQIKVYPHQVVFWNAGRLPENWSEQTLWRGHHSKPFNPNIAHALYLSGDIETWGSGYERIERAMQVYQLPKPDVTILGGLQICYTTDMLHWLVERSDLSEQQMKIVYAAWKDGRVDNPSVQALLNVSRQTATRLLASLTDYLDKQGTVGKGTYYTLKESFGN